MNNYEYYELDDYVDPNCPEQIYIREAGRGMAMDDLQEKIKAKDRYKELEQEAEEE
jgi:hypothetical protein